VECPLHAGRFDIKTGKAQGVPVTEDIKTFPVRVDGDNVYVEI
jgi:nitrite reductase/ring-hydroxylating ferredoxin subunit